MVKTPDKPYVKPITRNGKTYWYFRRGKTYLRLPDNPDSREFDEAYWSIRSGRAQMPVKTTFDALITSYIASPAFQSKAAGTKREYRRTLELLREKNGQKDFTKIRRRDVIAARDKYADQWRKANAMVEMLSILARHAIDLEWITANPAAGVEKLSGGEYQPWPEAKLNAFERVAEGTALTAYHLGVGTGQRIGDVCKMKWSDFDGDYMQVKQEKTGQLLWVYCPAKLKAYLATLPRRGDYILAKNLRQPMAKRAVQKAVEAVRDDIDARAYVIHGWRYTAAVELAEAGCSDTEIAAVTGHRSLRMVQKYRERANQRKLSRQAQEKRK